jgi:hypothetical protein
MNLNIMIDPSKLYPQSYHPCVINKSRDFTGRARHKTRTQRPSKYYYIDFGISRQYQDNESPLEYPIRGGDRSVPEFSEPEIPRNPFPTDIYYIGNLIKQEFLQVRTATYPCQHYVHLSLSAESGLTSWQTLSLIWFKMIQGSGLQSTWLSRVLTLFNND